MELTQISPSEQAIVVVERAVLRAVLPATVDVRTFEAALAAAWAEVVTNHSGQADILRVAHALDPHWHDPLRPPGNRAPATPARRPGPGGRAG
ncbi:MAG: hypothetical protein AB1673_09530 [Actinomycetota bacterium]